MTIAIDIRLAPDVSAPGIARAALSELAGRIPQSIFDDLKLLVSEIVTNSVRHVGYGQGHPIGIAVDISPTALRVEITDDGPGFKPRPVIDSAGLSHLGLMLVSRLAHRWGVDQGRPFTTWFELDLVV